MKGLKSILVLDVLLVRMTSDTIRPPEKRYNYSNALTGLVSLIRSEGTMGLMRGIGTNTVCRSLWVPVVFL
jgi:solute carrier family 25 (mitochondrial dicarboxylate transporter), member 10